MNWVLESLLCPTSLGCIPYVRALEFMPTGECSASANRVTEGYNKKLKRMVEKMNQEMGPESKFVYVNTKEFGSAEAEEGTRSNGKNDDLGGSSSTKPEGGLIQKLSEEASTVATKILMRHASDGLPRGRYWKTFQRAKYRHRERVGVEVELPRRFLVSRLRRN
ncbi:hypothetical protein ZEAMMB73_Zm00001d040087 [Zea mays]|uniref:GDSL esterase/lipase n=2 Tax=Zea mays TaxID=4577 RepID=A0A1D6MN19_MAIZE|nr:hypothetical protein ZEAMMB73_Zm00001d040087 [Zea mays]